MSVLQPAFLPKPFVVVRGRYHEIDLFFYLNYNKKTQTGTMRDLETEGYSFIADFRYDADSTTSPVFTIEGPGSPSEILVDGGKVTMILDEDNTKLFEVDQSDTMNFPFRVIYFELKAIDSDGKKMAAALGTLNVYQNVTKSDDGI